MGGGGHCLVHISILQSSIKTRHGQEHGAKAVEQFQFYKVRLKLNNAAGGSSSITFQFYKVRLKQERARRHLRTGDGISILQSSIKTAFGLVHGHAGLISILQSSIKT